MTKALASRLRHRVRIERPVASNGFREAGNGTWELVATVWAEVRDDRPSRSKDGDGIPTSARRARVQMRFRTDVTPNMRIVHGNRIMQIVSAIAELDGRTAIEMMVEDYIAAGNAA